MSASSTDVDHPLAKGAAWMKGEIIPISAASIPVTDWGVTHSDITYDVAPVWDGGFFRLTDYVGRFQESMAQLQLDIGMDTNSIVAALHEMVAASGLKSAYVAMVASRGVPMIPGTRDPRDCQNHFYAWCIPYVFLIRQEVDIAAHSLWVAKSVTRIPESALDPTIKNYQWGDFTKGLLEAKDNGAETAVLLDQDGNVTEGPGFNVFCVKDGRVITSDHGTLKGISRRTVLEMCAEAGIEVEVRPLPLAEFMQSDEVFLSTTGGGVVPITAVDGRIFSNGAAGAITTALYQRYWEWMHDPAYRDEINYPA